MNASKDYYAVIGDRIMEIKVLKLDPGRPGNPIGSFEFTISITDPSLKMIDCKDDVYAFRKADGVGVFGGYVDELFYTDKNAVLICKGGNKDYDKLKSSFNFLSPNPYKIQYFLARLMFKKNKIHFDGELTRRMNLIEREYVIIMSVKNLEISSDFEIANATFYNPLNADEDKIIRESTTGKIDPDWNEKFPRVKVTVKSTNFYDAIHLGYEKIAKTIDLIALRCDVLFPTFKDTYKLLDFSNDWYFSRVSLPTKIFCKEKESSESCLFDMRLLAETILKPEDPKKYLEPILNAFGNIINKADTDLTNSERLIVRSLYWLRSGIHSINPIDKLLSLSLSLEFATSEIRPAKIFSKQEIRRISKYLIKLGEGDTPLSSKQLEILTKKIDDLNNAPLLSRVEKFIKDNEIPFTKTEFELIRQVRRKRNDIEHGKKNIEVEREELEKLQSLIEKIIFIRANSSNQ